MNIIEAIKATDRNNPFITREKWSHPYSKPGGYVKILPTASPDCMILYSEANGNKNPRRGWQPNAEDLIAEDWKVVR